LWEEYQSDYLPKNTEQGKQITQDGKKTVKKQRTKKVGK
jgi:hypothetical protein